jgi:hypothetical protein
MSFISPKFPGQEAHYASKGVLREGFAGPA